VERRSNPWIPRRIISTIRIIALLIALEITYKSLKISVKLNSKHKLKPKQNTKHKQTQNSSYTKNNSQHREQT
jgi:hypothetical protein